MRRSSLRVAGLLAAISLTPLAVARADTPAGWVKIPTSDQLRAVWPREAFARGENGSARIRCKVSVQGGLFECLVVSETPTGSGFGDAAIALTPQFLMKPATHDGQPVVSEVVIPVEFAGLTRRMDPEQSQPGGEVVAEVPWVQAPTYADVVAAYPAKARAAKAGGHVALDCAITGDGHLTLCHTIAETPTGMGFGAAAHSLARDFVGPTVDAAGHSVRGDTTQVAVTFAPEMLATASPVIGKPQWAHLPKGLDVAQAFPAQAIAAHVATGHVALQCDVAAAGHLANCEVERQDPAGMGFDKAALALAPLFQVSVWTDEGLPTVGGRITVPIRYEAPDSPAATPPAKP